MKNGILPANIPFGQIEGNIDGLADFGVIHVTNNIGIIKARGISHQGGIFTEEIKNALVFLLWIVNLSETRGDS